MKFAPDIDDQELTYQLQVGSKEAFRQLYERYGPRIHRFACGYLKSDHDAEELVQDVFIKLWDKRAILDSSNNIRAYIYKVAVNSIYDLIRKRNLEKAFQDFSGGLAIDTYSTWDEVVFKDMLTQISLLMEQMPEQRRKIFKLSKEVGLTNDEIAAQLDLSKRTVENQLYRATLFLKNNLKLDSALALLFFYLFC